MHDSVVWFRGMDAWYHMRLVDNLVANFPHLTAFDPFTGYPNGIEPPFHPLTGWLIAGAAMVLGGGAPSTQLIDITGAFYPVVLGALTIVPAYFTARALFGRVAGVATAFMLAILPGEFLSRSLLGFADHHVTEAFFATWTLLFLVLATRRVAALDMRPGSVRQHWLAGERRSFVYVLLAGISLGLYLLSWRGGIFLVLVLFVYVAVRAIVDYARHVESNDVVIVLTPAIVLGGAMVLPIVAQTWTPALFITALLGTAVSPLALRYIAHYVAGRGWQTRSYAAMLVGMGVAAVGVLAVVAPSAIRNALSAIDFMIPTGESLSITEMHPLFLPSGQFSLHIAWTNFVTVLPVSMLALVLLLRDRRIRKGSAMLFLVWAMVMLVAVLTQRRFGYYYAGSAAILTGYLVERLWQSEWVQRRVATLRRYTVANARTQKKAGRRAVRAQQAERRSAGLTLASVAAVLILVLVSPSIDMAHNFAAEPSLMTRGWMETLQWLERNSEEPMGPDAYYALFDTPSPGEEFDYPDSAYSIMAWWDYGHWLTRVSKRIPVSNPFQQGAQTAASYFLASDEATAEAQLDFLDTRYIIVDAKTAVASFHGVALWGQTSPANYFQTYTQHTPEGKTERLVLYYPSYFQTMLARLFSFRAEAAEPEMYDVIRYTTSGRAEEERTISDLERFESYEEAQAYIEASKDLNVALVSASPFRPCVPIEGMDGYSLVFESSTEVQLFGKRVPEVRIFEYSGA